MLKPKQDRNQFYCAEFFRRLPFLVRHRGKPAPRTKNGLNKVAMASSVTLCDIARISSTIHIGSTTGTSSSTTNSEFCELYPRGDAIRRRLITRLASGPG